MTKGDLIVEILLQQLGNVKGDLSDEVVVHPQLLVQLQLQQHGGDGGQLVVGQQEAMYVILIMQSLVTYNKLHYLDTC